MELVLLTCHTCRRPAKCWDFHVDTAQLSIPLALEPCSSRALMSPLVYTHCSYWHEHILTLHLSSSNDLLLLSHPVQLLLRSQGCLALWRRSVSEDTGHLDNTDAAKEEVDCCQSVIYVSTLYRREIDTLVTG